MANRTRILLYVESADAPEHEPALAAEGFETSVAVTSDEVLRAVLGASPPALVVIDRAAPDWRFTRALKADGRTGRIPLIALADQHLSPLEVKQTGCAAVLPKPCSPDELVVAIENALGSASRPTLRPEPS